MPGVRSIPRLRCFRLRSVLAAIAASALALPISAQDWTEIGDAGSFPGEVFQQTVGTAEMTTISGTLTSASSDIHDSYCIEIVDADGFRATTSATVDSLASRAFDTRLFLFALDGTALLANDDHDGSDFGSTLTSTSNSGPALTLTEGEYVLTVTGFPEDPVNSVATPLFDLVSDFTGLWASSLARDFATWENTAAPDGAYTIALRGVRPCRGRSAIVIANGTGDNAICRRDSTTEQNSCEAIVGSTQGIDVASGDMDGDGKVDLIFAENFAEPEVCLGTLGRDLTCTSQASGSPGGPGALGVADFNGDGHLDVAVGINDSPTVGSLVDRLCLGDGDGGFSSCTDYGADEWTYRIHTADIDRDGNQDIISDGGADRYCLGDGTGGMSCHTTINDGDGSASGDPRGLAVGFLNHDALVDVVWANFGNASQVCLGTGLGGADAFTCSELATPSSGAWEVDLGDLDRDGNLDAVFAIHNTSTSLACLGDGLGGFTCSNISLGKTIQRQDVKLGYLDGDHHLDAVFGDENGGSAIFAPDGENILCLGNGDGTFSCEDLTATLWNADSIQLVEWPDIIFWTGFENGSTGDWQ